MALGCFDCHAEQADEFFRLNEVELNLGIARHIGIVNKAIGAIGDSSVVVGMQIPYPAAPTKP